MKLCNAFKFYMDGEILPQTPESVTLSNSNKNEQFTLADGQPFTVAKYDGPYTVEFSFTVTRESYPFTFPEADRNRKSWEDRLAAYKRDRNPIELVISRPGGYASYFEVLLEDYSVTEDANESSDAEFSVSFIEYCPQNNQELDSGVEHHLITAGEARGWVNDVDKAELEEEARIAAEEEAEQSRKEEELDEKEAAAEERRENGEGAE